MNQKYIQDLFEAAGLESPVITVVENIGYGMIQPRQASVFDNMFHLDQEVVSRVDTCFEQAQGVFLFNLFNTFNPIWWFRSIFFLPKRLLKYLGLSEEKISFRIINVLLTLIWWSITAVLAYLGITKTSVQEFFNMG